MKHLEDHDQSELRSLVQRISMSEIPKFQNERFFGTTPRELFTKLAEAGVTGLSIPEQYGGIGASATTSAIVMEELARVDLGPAIFISVQNMVAGMIAKHGTKLQKEHYLPKMASGDILGAFALTEPEAGSDAANIKSTYTKVSDGFLIQGGKAYISSAGFADLYLVFARSSQNADTNNPWSGISAFIVDSNSPGLNIGQPEKKMGCELSPIASLMFDNMKVPLAALVGQEGDGYKIALSGLAGGRINISACANGISRAAIEIASKHLVERSQFGQPLSEFQGLQFMLADMAIKLESSLLCTWNAATLMDRAENKSTIRKSSSIAKCLATDSAMSITTDAVQLLGGAGYLKEYRVEKLMRDAKMLQIVEGTNQIQRSIIAREVFRAL